MDFLFLKAKKLILYCSLVLLVFFLSMLGFLYPLVNSISFWAIITLALFLTLRKLEYGVLILLLELFIGSKGYLFSFPFGSFVVSLRLALFLLVIFRYFFIVLKERNIIFLKTKLAIPFFLFCSFLIFGVINGLYHNPLKVVFYDFNSYLYLALIFPVFHVLSKRETVRSVIKLLSVAAISLSILTVAIQADFSIFHYCDDLVEATKVDAKQLEELEELSDLPENARLGQTTSIAKEKLRLNWGEQTNEKPIIYRWLKDTGLAEVTYIQGRFFRVFMAGQFYVIIYFLLLFVYFTHHQFISIKKRILPAVILLLLIITIIISYSRSFWLGLFIAGVISLFGLSRKKMLVSVSAIILIALIFLTLFYFFSLETIDLIKERTSSFFSPSSELAATSRVNLLNPILDKIKEKPFLGSGFGTLVTYKSLIPTTDLVEYVKVYQYEWAYLDIAVKIGILGLIFYLIFCGKLIQEGRKSLRFLPVEEAILVRGLLSAVAFLLAVNLTTPFLNHPLGLGLLILAGAIFYRYSNTGKNHVLESIN